MNEPATQFQAPAGQTEDLQDEVQSLRLTLCISLILMMVFGACVDFYLVKQISDLRSSLGKVEPDWKVFEAKEPAEIAKAVDFWNKLNEYTKTHPDLAPLMSGASRFISLTLLNPANAPKKK